LQRQLSTHAQTDRQIPSHAATVFVFVIAVSQNSASLHWQKSIAYNYTLYTAYARWPVEWWGYIQNGHKPKRPHDYGEHVNKYLSLNKGIFVENWNHVRSRFQTKCLILIRVVHGLGWPMGWVGLGQLQQKYTKNLKGFVLAFWAAAKDILNISLNSLYLNDIMTLF